MAFNGEQRKPDGTFASGHRGGPGRPPGVPNRTGLLRQQLEAAILKLGGQSWIDELVRENGLEALKLLTRLQPTTVGVSIDKPTTVQVNMYLEKPTDEQREAVESRDFRGLPEP